jgi:DNA polymerase-3 subunit delta
VAARETAGVSVIVGSDSFLAEEALESLLEEAVGTDREGTVQVLRGEETSWTRMVDNVGMGSLFAERRAVVVRGAEGLKGDGDEMGAYLQDPTRGVALILLAAKPDRRRVVWKRLLERARVISVEAPKGRALRSFVEERLRRRKLRLSEEGCVELIDRVGQDLRRLVGEIDKLEAFADGQRTLSAEDVAAVLGRGLAQPLYKLGDAFARRQVEETLGFMQALMEEGESPQRILATLHRSLRQIRGARVLRERRGGREEAIKRLGLLPFKAGDVLEASRRWSEDELARAMTALGRADRLVKTGTAAEVALVAAVASACGGKAARGREGLRPSFRPAR